MGHARDVAHEQKTPSALLALLDRLTELRPRQHCDTPAGEASNALSRFLCFGKEGHLRGREYGDELPTSMRRAHMSSFCV